MRVFAYPHAQDHGALELRHASRVVARVRAERAGRLAEWLAMLWLVLRGYRILSRRWRVRQGELDLIAVRGRRLAFVEVKWRRERALAEASVRRAQCLRLYAAADAFVARHPAYAACERGFDALFLAPQRLPLYARDHLQPKIGRAF